MKTCAFIIISSVTTSLCLHKGILTLQKVPQIMASHTSLPESAGLSVKQTAALFIREKAAAEGNVSVCSQAPVVKCLRANVVLSGGLEVEQTSRCSA